MISINHEINLIWISYNKEIMIILLWSMSLSLLSKFLFQAIYKCFQDDFHLYRHLAPVTC